MVCINTMEYDFWGLHRILALHTCSHGTTQSLYNHRNNSNCASDLIFHFAIFSGNIQFGDHCLGWWFSSETIPRDLLLFGGHDVCMRHDSSRLCNHLVSDLSMKLIHRLRSKFNLKNAISVISASCFHCSRYILSIEFHKKHKIPQCQLLMLTWARRKNANERTSRCEIHTVDAVVY